MAYQSELNPPPASPNLSFNPGVNIDTAPAQIALQQLAQQRQVDQQSVSNVQKTAEQASQLVQSFVQAAQQRQQRNALASLQSLTARGGELVPGNGEPKSAPTSTLGTVPIAPPMVPYSSTPDYKAQQMAALFAADPKYALEQQAKQTFGEPKSIDQLAAESIQAGRSIPSEIKDYLSLKAGLRSDNNSLRQIVNPDGTVGYGVFDKENNTFKTVQGAQAPKMNQMQKSDIASANLEEKKREFAQKRIDKLEEQYSIENASSRKYLGKSADVVRRVQNAQELMERNGGNLTRQEGAALANDMANLLAGGSGGGAGENMVKMHEYKSAYGDIQNFRQWLSGDPQKAMPKAMLDRLKNDFEGLGIVADKAIKNAQAGALYSNQDLKDNPKYGLLHDKWSIDPSEIVKGKYQPKPKQIDNSPDALKASLRQKLGL